MESETDLMTLPEVADRLRRTPAALRYLRHIGQGPRCALIAGRIMYRRADVDTWIQEQFDADEARFAGRS